MRFLKMGGGPLVYGEGALDYLCTLPGKRAFVVCDPVAQKLGRLELVRQKLAAAGMESGCFADVEPDPEIANVLRGAEKMRAFAPDWIIALGGGSTIDTAKTMWIAYEYPEFDTLDRFMPPNKIPPLRQKAHMLSIPTTSGTGSEATGCAVITDGQRQVKLAFNDLQLMSDVTVLDPALVETMPPALTAQTGMDALTHAVESYVSAWSSPYSMWLSEQAAADIFQWLPKAWKDGSDKEARLHMQMASTLAGMAFANVGLGLAHCMAHAYGALFHIPHGLGNAVMLPYAIRYNGKDAAVRAKYQAMARRLGVESLETAVMELCAGLELPDRMSVLIPDRADFDAALDGLVERTIHDVNAPSTPVPIPAEQVRVLLIETYLGRQ